MGGSPLQFEKEHLLISHSARAAQHTFDRRVQRFDDAESDWVIAGRGDAVDVLQQEVAETLHFGQPLTPTALRAGGRVLALM